MRTSTRRTSTARSAVAAAAMLVVLTTADHVQSQSSDKATNESSSPAELEKSLTTRRDALEKTQTQAKSIETDLKLIREQRERLNTRLLETGALIQKSESQLTAIEARLGELEAQEKIVRGSLDQRRGSIAKLLSALQRMGRNPPPVMITQREDALKMVRSAMMIAAAFPEMRGQALALATRLQELVRVMKEIRSEGDRLKAETQHLTKMRTELSGLLAEKKQKITNRQSELQEVRLAATEISKSVNDLNELIAKLDRTVRQNSRLAEYDAAVQPSQAGGEDGAVTPGTGATDTQSAVVAMLPPRTRPEAPPLVELAPGGQSYVPGPADRITPSIPFADAKGRLPFPAHGKRVLSFGEKTQYGGQSKGVVLETRPFGQVVSPSDGWIVYAGEFRSYGQLLIINAGGGYHILVAGLSRIDVQPGQFVLAAEPVGSMRGLPSRGQGNAQNIAQSNAPVLYLEFRKDGKPIDPDPWWAKGDQMVQG